jgi:phosphoenolpyruvate synthase/pyruvate phosphate dikinase
MSEMIQAFNVRTNLASSEYVLPLANPGATLETVGGKGASLARLVAAGLPVPGGFHVTTSAYRQFVAENGLQPGILAVLESADPEQPATLGAVSRAIRRLFAEAEIPPAIAGAIAQAYAELAGRVPVVAGESRSDSPKQRTQSVAVAVRSSATAEDLPEASFAGQQDTYLNVRGAEAVLQAVKRCWASLWTARAIGYRAQHAIDQDAVSLAVVVQELVPAEAAGIMFTANPVTGKRDEAVISAAWGLGEAVVGGLVTPDNLTVDKATGEVLARETADKQVMTVRVDGGTEEQPVPEELRDAPVLDDEQAAELVRLGVQIEELYGMPMDIEWALADGTFAIVQARPITALPEPEAEPPTEWPMPDPKGQYVRASVAELLPNPLTPLFATLGRAAINAGTRRLMGELGGTQEGWPEETVVTINDYAYYSARFTPKQMLRLVTTMPFTMPRMMRHAETRWRDVVHPRYMETIQRWQARLLNELPATDILVGVRQIADASFDIYALYQSALFPNANLSEMLFTRVYDRLIKREDDPPALIYVLGFDSTPILAEKSLYDISAWCRTRPALAAYVANTPARQLAVQLEDDQVPSGVEAEDWREWQSRFRAHLQQYGHIIYDLDFAKPLPVDDPTPLLDTCKMFLSGQCASPYERQQAAAERREQATQAMLERLKGLRLKLFRKLVIWAQKGVPQREEGLADLGLGYPQLRRMLRELGRRLVQAGAVEQPDDVFWLFQDEVEQAAGALGKGEFISFMTDAVKRRKAVWRAEQRATPPPVLPPKSKWMGLDLGTFVAAEDAEQAGDTIRGAGTSPGRVTGTARVLHGPEDFDQMRPGDVLVAAITTPAWTPLFARATAIVTDIGGQLSHGSIVAREYGIPAVMGTGVATKRIQSGQTISVDGSTGEVVLHKSQDEQTPPAAIEWKRPNPKGQYMRGSLVDIMPDPVSPLFATLGLPAVGRVGIKEVMRPLTRSEPILPEDYVLTINDYAYMGVAFTPRQLWWIITRMLLSFPRIIREALPLWRDEIRPRYVETVARWQDVPLEAMPAAELWTAIQEINDAAMLHLASLLVATTGASAGSEMLFTRVYEKMIQRGDGPVAATFLMGYDSTPIRAEKSLYDLAMWGQDRGDLAAYLLETPTDQLAAQLTDGQSPEHPEREPSVRVEGWRAFCERFRDHLHDYGHIIYDLDFAKPLPLDDPTPMLETIKMYLRSEGVNPHVRQHAAEEKRVQAAEATLKRLKGLRRWAFRKTLGMAQTMAQVRENALADIGLGYPLLRQMLRELGRRFVQAGAIAQPNDIFWLKVDEVQDVIANLPQVQSLRDDDIAERVAQRKAIHEALKRVAPPPMLPPRKKYMGFDMETWTPAAEGSQSGGTLKGIGASAGRVTAPARVLCGPQDFGQMRPGDVLVASTTTPAWTPLFAMASAVVTDIGGPLSHGSIVAREYGIPAVMGTGVATRRIRSGQVVTVDGSAGTVTLPEQV